MTVGLFTLVLVAGLAGPFLSAVRFLSVPVVVGEILAGVIIGNSWLGLIDVGDPLAKFLSDLGFAVLMFGAGMHVPIHDRRLRAALGRGVVAAAATGVLGALGGYGIAQVVGGKVPALVWGILLATGSAAVVLPALIESGLEDDATGLVTMAWVTVADVATIVALPLVMQPSKAVHASLGGLAVGATALAVWLVGSRVGRLHIVHHMRKLSKKRGWVLDLRLALIALFGLTWLARELGTSPLVAGFSAGLIVGAIGGPKRLTTEVAGVAGGLFVPVFFVLLGARIDLGALASSSSALLLIPLIAFANLAIHVVVARGMRLPIGVGMIATAQLGVPAAVAQIGLEQHVLVAGQGAAVLAAAMLTLLFTAVGTRLLTRHAVRAPAAPPPAAAAT